MSDAKDANQTDYRDTLFLPKTDFPMRAGLPKVEPEWLKKWEEELLILENLILKCIINL